MMAMAGIMVMVVMEAIMTEETEMMVETMMMVMVVMALTRDDKEVNKRSTVEPKDCCSSNCHSIATKGL